MMTTETRRQLKGRYTFLEEKINWCYEFEPMTAAKYEAAQEELITTALIFLGMATMGGSRQWLKMELEK
jgi:hypothetical protein